MNFYLYDIPRISSGEPEKDIGLWVADFRTCIYTRISSLYVITTPLAAPQGHAGLRFYFHSRGYRSALSGAIT